MLDGAARISDLVKEVAAQDMPAIAMTDHGQGIALLHDIFCHAMAHIPQTDKANLFHCFFLSLWAV